MFGIVKRPKFEELTPCQSFSLYIQTRDYRFQNVNVSVCFARQLTLSIQSILRNASLSPSVSDPHCAAEEDPARGRVRRLRGYRLEVNGRVYARVAADKTSMTLRKCKSGMKYTCVLVAISGPEKMEGCQGKVSKRIVLFFFLASSNTFFGGKGKRQLYVKSVVPSALPKLTELL